MTTTNPAPTPSTGPEDGPDDTDVNLGIDKGQAADADAAHEPEQGAEEVKGRRSAYLPVLPDGWHYEVNLIGPDGTQVEILPDNFPEQAAASSPHRVTFKPNNDDARRLHTLDLAEATRAAASGAKLLDRLHKGEQEVRKARDEALSVLGGAPRTPGDH